MQDSEKDTTGGDSRNERRTGSEERERQEVTPNQYYLIHLKLIDKINKEYAGLFARKDVENLPAYGSFEQNN